MLLFIAPLWRRRRRTAIVLLPVATMSAPVDALSDRPEAAYAG
jgi:hypothetical protein